MATSRESRRRLRLLLQELEGRIVPTFPLSPTAYSQPQAFLFPDADSSSFAADAIMASATRSSLSPAPTQVTGSSPWASSIDPGYATIGSPPGANADTGLQLSSPFGVGPSGNATEGFSAGGVRYFDGVFQLTSTDLASDGFGAPWTQTRSWSNAATMADGHHNGSGWVDTQFPTLWKMNAGDYKTLALVSNGTVARFFIDRLATSTSGNYTERFYGQNSLKYEGGQYVLTTPAGVRFFFAAFGGSTISNLVSRVDAYGNTVAVGYSGGKVSFVSRGGLSEGELVLETWTYEYVDSGVNTGLLEKVTVARGPRIAALTTIRQVFYEYYDSNGEHGSIGDLKYATVSDGASNLGTQYYRYYDGETSAGFPGALKMAFGYASLDRLAAAYDGDLEEVEGALDSDIVHFADAYLQYGAGGRVSVQKLQGAGSSGTAGGIGTFSFTYDGNPSPSTSHTRWAVKTTITLPDGNQNIVHTNAYGQVILRVFKEVATGSQWATFYQHDGRGRVTLVANPSAISGTNGEYPSLIIDPPVSPLKYDNLRDTSGLIVQYRYGTSTTGGDVVGYWKAMDLKRGEDGAAQAQFDIKYSTHQVAGLTLYLQSQSITYPTASPSVTRTTTYAYTFFTGKAAVETVTVTHPAISSNQNGPGGTGDTEKAWADRYGRVIWTQDAGGFLSYIEYGSPSYPTPWKIITDVNTTISTNEPSGVSTPAGGGLHLLQQQVADELGRVTRVQTPGNRVSYVVYEDANHEARVYPGWVEFNDPSVGATTGPTVVYRDDRKRGYSEVLTMSVAPTVAYNVPTGTEAIGSLQTLTRTIVNAAGQHVKTDEYHDLDDLQYLPTDPLGSLNTNFYRTEYDYDAKGLLDRTARHTGTISRTVYDALGRAASTWVGTNDAPGTSNLTKVSEFIYDFGGVGDGNVTVQVDYVGGGEPERVTEMAYDWRNRLIATKQGVESLEDDDTNRPIFYVEFNNLGETIYSERYDGDGLSIYDGFGPDGVPDRPDDDFLRGKTGFDIDDQGRVYRTKHYWVDPVDGTPSTAILTSQNWFDRRGNLLKTVVPGVTVTKYAIDGAGRTTIVYTSDGGNDNDTWANAGNVDGDTVLEQVETEYDQDGLPWKTTLRQRFHDESDTGALTDPNGTVQARASFTGTYYDLAGRVTHFVDVGTAYISQGSLGIWTRPTNPPDPSNTELVVSYLYNPAGWVSITTDPRELETWTLYDNLGRVTTTIENYVNGVPSDEDDKTTEFEYDGSDNLTLHRLVLPDDDEQTTEYFYDYQSSTITSNDLLAEVWHPDETTGEASQYEAELLEYNALGETIATTDRNGWTHKYVFDPLGRLLKDEAWAGSTLNSWLQTNYDGQGNAYLFTTWDFLEGVEDPVIFNQVMREFDGRGQMVVEWQEADGAVIATSAKVEYAYAEQTSGGTMFSRLTGISYPLSSGSVSYSYGATSDLNHFISRVSSINGGGGISESYQYLGAATVVSRTSGNGLTWRHYGGAHGTGAGEAGDQYQGLDRFGRAIGWLWNVGNSATAYADFHKYGYDRNSNRLYKTDQLHHAWDELYHENGADKGYDGFNQLQEFRRGVLSDTNSDNVPDTIATGIYERWNDIDAAGNFWNISASNGTEVRTHNLQNQITELNNEDLFYDDNGNLIEDTAFARTFQYDAWNRLIAIINENQNFDGPRYEYDALGRRIVEGTVQPAPYSVNYLFYNAAWQVIHDRHPGPVADPEGEPIPTYHSFNTYYWSAAGSDTMIGRARAANNIYGQYDERLYSLQDAQGNQSALADLTGVIKERSIQTPYGDQSTYTHDRNGQIPTVYQWRYFHQGLRLDKDGDFYDNRHRFYSPTLMRFIQNDPIGFAAGDPNFYRYVENGPVSATDPSGLQDRRRVVTTATGNRIPVANDIEAGLVRFMTQYEGRGQAKEAGAALRALMVDITMLPITPIANTVDFGIDLIPAALNPYYQPRNAALNAFLIDPHGNFGSAWSSLTLDAGATVTIASSLSGLASRFAATESRIVAAEVRGGAYVLRDAETVQVMRTGRTKDLLRREGQHARDPRFKNFDFEPIYRTDVYAEQRGLEQMLHDKYLPPFDLINPISPRNPNRAGYMNAAEEYLKRQRK